MLNEVKHLANVSCQVPARDSSDATLCQNDTQRGEKAFMDNCYIISKEIQSSGFSSSSLDFNNISSSRMSLSRDTIS